MTVRLALTADSRWVADLAEVVAAAHDAGFAAIGVNADRIDTSSAAVFAAAAVRCHELLALMVSGDAAADTASAERLARAAACGGAEWVTTVFAVPVDSRVLATLRRCAAILAEAGARMAVEFSALGPLPTMASALELVDAVGAGVAGVVIDTWHFAFGGGTWNDLAGFPLDRIAFVQFTDALVPESDRMMSETMNRRVMPGDGMLELGRFADTLLGRGWEGTVSVEVLNRELRLLSVAEFASRAHASTVRYWS